MKIRIRDFQSLEDASLEVKGFTVIVGDTNIGKSSVIRAIEGLFSNRSVEGIVRKGSRFVEVNMTTSEFEISWKKGGGHNDYTLNGEVFHSVGRGSFPGVREFGFRPFETSSSEVSVQVGTQHKPLFLIDEKESLAAEVLSDIGRLTEIENALKACQSDQRAAKATLKVRKKDLGAVEEDLLKLESLESDLKLLGELDILERSIEELHKDQVSLDNMITQREFLEEKVSYLSEASSVEIPSLEGFEDLSKLKEMDSIGQLYKRLSHVASKVEPFIDIEIPEDLVIETSLISKLRYFEDQARGLREESGRTKPLYAVEIPLLQDLEERSSKVKELEKLFLEVKGVATERREAKAFLTTVEKEAESLEEAYHNTLHELGECPLCGSRQ